MAKNRRRKSRRPRKRTGFFSTVGWDSGKETKAKDALL